MSRVGVGIGREVDMGRGVGVGWGVGVGRSVGVGWGVAVSITCGIWVGESSGVSVGIGAAVEMGVAVGACAIAVPIAVCTRIFTVASKSGVGATAGVVHPMASISKTSVMPENCVRPEWSVCVGIPARNHFIRNPLSCTKR